MKFLAADLRQSESLNRNGRARGRVRTISNCAFITGYEHDRESGLDFAEARMYSKSSGRFTSADPLLASAIASQSQSWNRFAYVANNPMKYADPSGLCAIPSGLQVGQVGIGICVEAFIQAKRVNVFGHGDDRTHEGNNPDATARMRFSVVISTTPTSFHQDV
jgi:RHS repeat-associated protein